MLSTKIEKILNDQVEIEAFSSQIYLAMACWAETQGLEGTAQFLYMHSDEERAHMLKLIKYINERGGTAIIPALDKPSSQYNSVKDLFETLLEHELFVSSSINNVVGACFEEKDFTTQNFMQWYVSEQIEEEALARAILDKLKLVNQDKSGLYFFDKDIENIASSITQSSPQ